MTQKKISINIENIVIIGGGPAGLAAAIYLARAGLEPLVLAGSPPGGQLMLTSEVENYPGFESILGPELIEKMRAQAKKFGARIVDQNVVKTNFKKKPFEIYLPTGPVENKISDESTKIFSQDQLASSRGLRRDSLAQTTDFRKNFVFSSNNNFYTKAVIIATGAKAIWLGLESEQRLLGKGVSSCATCDGFFFRNKVVGVVGGGDTATEEALTLTKFAKKVYIIHRRAQLRASRIMQERVLRNPKIEVIWNATVEKVLGENKVEAVELKITGPVTDFLPTGAHLEENDKVGSLKARSLDNKQSPVATLTDLRAVGSPSIRDTRQKKIVSLSSILKLDGLFIAIGHKPDTDVFVGNVELDSKGYIITSERFAMELAKLKVTTPAFAKASAGKQNSKLQNKFDFNYQYMTSVDGVFAAGDCVDDVYQQVATAVGTGVAAALEVKGWLESVSAKGGVS